MVSTWRLAGQAVFCELHSVALVLTSPHRYSNGLQCAPEESKKGFYIYRLARAALKSQPVRKSQKNNGGEGKPWPHKLSALISLLVSGTFPCSGQTSCEMIFFPFSLICLLYSHGEGGANTCLLGVLLQSKQVNGLAHQQGAGFLSDTHLLNVPCGKRLSTFIFPQNCGRISCWHKWFLSWSEIVPALESTGGERCRDGSFFLTFAMDSTVITKSCSQPWKWMRCTSSLSIPSPFLV